MLRNKCYPRCLLLAALAAAVAGCSGGLTDNDESGGQATGVPVAFAVSVDKKPDAAGRAATIAGEATTANIKSMGVFAYYTGAADFVKRAPNFMNDQEISRTSAAQPWTYSPMKYWPNTAGDKITFIAYSPHSSHFTEKDPDPDPLPEHYYCPGGTFEIGLGSGTPYYTIAPRLQAEKQTDVLIAPSLMNRTKTAGQITFQFKHLLAKVVFKVRSTEPIRIDRINISDVSSCVFIYYNNDATYDWDEWMTEDKVFFSLPAKDVPANVATAVSTFFMIPYPYTANALLDVHYANADGSTEEKNGIPFGYVASESGDVVEYTITIEGGAKISVTSTGIGTDWPTTDTDAGDEDVSAM